MIGLDGISESGRLASPPSNATCRCSCVSANAFTLYVGAVRPLLIESHGSSFKILLPRTDRTAEFQSVLPQKLALAKGSETILLVEDDEQVRTVTCTILRRSGYQVLDASNGGEAFLISKDFPGVIHMLLSDVVMPRMNGPKLAQHLAPERPDMKVLFVSGYTDDALRHHGVPHQDFAFLSKPITPHALLRKVREVLDPHHAASGLPAV